MTEVHDFNPGILKIAKGIHGSNIVFVIDASDPTSNDFELIKAFTIELIDIFMCQIDSYSFNVVSFSDCYSKLSNVLMPCCKSTAVLASEWIQTLNCATSKNALLALGTAYTDPDADAVIMLTDGLMQHISHDVTKCVAELSRGRPLHIIHINDQAEDLQGLKFLESLAVCTFGTLHSIKQVSKCMLREVQIYPQEDNNCGERTSDGSCSSFHDTSDESEAEETAKEVENGDEKDKEGDATAEDNILGKIVLARKGRKGYYYKGAVIKVVSRFFSIFYL